MNTLIVPEDDLFLRIKAVAALLGVSHKTVRRWIDSGKIASVKMGGLRVIKRSEFKAFLQRLSGMEAQDV